jgi:hypothetical protein
MALKRSDFYPLSDFQRKTRDRMTRLKELEKPAVLTVNGQAELVIQSAEAYQKLLNGQQLLESIQSISRGLNQAKRGEIRPMRTFLQTLASQHGFTLK